LPNRVSRVSYLFMDHPKKGIRDSTYYHLKPNLGTPMRAKRESQARAVDARFNQRDHTLVLVCCCSAMALETLSELRWYHFEEDWMRQKIPHINLPSELLKGHGKGKYKGVRQVTFVTPETKRELIKYREWMTKQYRVFWRNDMHVFLSLESPHDPLAYHGVANAVVRISREAGVPFNSHDGRRVVETALEDVNTPRNWIQKVKGCKVREEDAPYSKPAVEQLRRKYREALGDLEFLTPTEQPGAGLTADQQSVFGKLAQLLDENPDKAAKFEKFLLDL
jgi:hypothetical protein